MGDTRNGTRRTCDASRKHLPADPNPMTYDATDKLVLWPGMVSFKYYPTGSLHEQWNAAGTVLGKIHSYTGAELLWKVVHGDDPETDPTSTMT